jgi:FKBP-type peptidyl-prolyl cis-trans isomerase SlyD
MEAIQNKVVSIIYELRKDDVNGDLVEKLSLDNPLTFIFGKGQLLPKFEDNLRGKKTGDNFSFQMKCDDAYGLVKENAIIDIPINIFEIDGKLDSNLLQIGNVVPMMDREGRRLDGVVKMIGTENVTMDFNHPMAGKDLFFSGEITEIREATEEELMHGHTHLDSDCEGCNDDSCQSKKPSDQVCGCGCS